MAGIPKALRRAIALASTAAVVLLAGVASAAAGSSAGSAGVGDPFFPNAGNGGYDVQHYELGLRVHSNSSRINATARITAIATQPLTSFNLDYRGPRIVSVKMNGLAADFAREGQELIVEGGAASAGEQFTTIVRYRGTPHPITDPDGSKEGWFETGDGSLVVAEPQGSPSWYPVNDHPTDKATYTFRVRVRKGLEAIANGRLVKHDRAGPSAEWVWRTDEPMAPYLATVATGQFKIRRSKVSGIPSIVAVDPSLWKASRPALRRSGRIIGLFEQLFGPYPFGQVGAIVDDASFIGYALETQTRPTYSSAPDQITVAHELAHQWFGNSVTLASWPEIWLHEGFATWAEWRWDEERGGPTTAQMLEQLEATPASEEQTWSPPPAAVPGPAELFARSVYVRGGMALEALRQRVGDDAFYATLSEWASQNAYANAAIADFIALAEAQSGQQLDALFDRYLFQAGKP